MRLLFKNSIKKIFKSFGRFISISLIVLIGTSVFVGLKEATPSILYTADNYYDTHNLMDLKITSNYGLTNEDIKALENVKDVYKVIPSYSIDILSSGEAIRLHAIEEDINNVYLLDGRMPTKNNECLGDFKKYKIGDKIKLEEKSEFLNETEFEIVGLIKSPLYIYNSYGITNIENGKLSSFAFIKKETFKYDYYTESYIIAKNSQELHSYKNEYKDLIEDLKDNLKETKEKQENARYENLIEQIELSMRDYPSEIVEVAKEKIEKPTWYILDRNDNFGYQNYKDDALKVEAISKILPIFFVIVAMLMCLNTLTRMIEEERTEIGVLQANGFSKSSIILSYLYYVFTSTIIGLIIGLTVGYTIISKIIYNVFTANYSLPQYIGVVDNTSLTLVIIITLSLMIVATGIACNKELKDNPSDLLRPKPPKSGKKVFLEKFKKTWAKLSFMNKITIRNLFRYKKRIIMTVLGVAGCTALLLTGFGLNDSINIISQVQYNDIIKYDSTIVLKEEIDDMPTKIQDLLKENNIDEYLLINQNTYTYSYDDKEETVYLIVPNNTKEINKYVYLENLDKKETKLNDDGAIISNQMAEQLGVSRGDSITIKNSDKKEYTIQIEDIVYNYVSHYIYMTPHYYEKIFDNKINYNNIIINGKIPNETNLSDYNIYMINETKDIVSTFDTLIKSINSIIILIIICACLLAFAVLYNLTIINVNERKREIATFKVLGFNDREIFVFIYRETFMLTILGILLGLVFGIFLHRYIIATAQTGNIQFMYNIRWYSYILSALITIIFSLFVQLLINRTLRKIDMIDSLKSVE